MLRWSSALRLSLRLHCTHSARTDPLLEKFKRSTSKFHIFQLVGIHRPMLTLEHVTCAMNLLWKFHNRNHNELRSVGHIRRHPEFVSLCNVVENNIDLMDDSDLVDILHIVDSFQVEAHSSLVQRLVTEGWRRLQRLDLLSLSTFAACLKRQNMTTSPLMGQIASIVDSSLDDLEDPATLASLLCSLYAVSSPSLQERLMGKTESTIEKLGASHSETALRLVDILSKDKSNLSLMKKCDRYFQENVRAIDSQTICSIMKVYQSQHFTNCEFNVAAKARLMEEVDRFDHPDYFADLFVVLSPIASLKMRERLETKLASYADQISLNNLPDVLNIMATAKSTNTALIQKICSRLWKHLGVCSTDQLCSIVEAVMLLGSQDGCLQPELEMHLKRCMLSSFIPSDVAQIMAAMSVLNPYQIDEVIISKLYDNLAQFNFLDLSRVTFAILHLLQSTDTAHRRTLGKLLTATNTYRLKKVSKAKCLDSLLLEMKDKEGTSRMEMELVEATFNTYQRLIQQLSWKNVTQLSILVLRMNTQCPALLDKIAMVAMDNLDKFYASALYPILRIFSYMNHNPPQGNEFFDACAHHLINNMDALSPHFLVMTTYIFAVAGYFQEELIKAIFNTSFLHRFDAQLDAFNPSISKKSHFYLMELNRAICIEHPEYGVPWFHEQYCQQTQHRRRRAIHYQIHEILSELFGGTNYTKVCVRTPYCYFVDIEYILDKDGNPIAYEENDGSMSDHDSQLQENKPLPAGAQRFAVDFLHHGACLRNSLHVKGSPEMKKRHLEILGYRVIQIPVFEWNATRLGTEVAIRSYLKKKIFADDVYRV